MYKLPSNIGTLQGTDFLKGLVMAVIVPVLLAVQQSLSADHVVFNWKALGMTAVAAFIGYLIKNLSSNSVPSAEKTIATAQAKVIAKQNT